MRLRRRDFVLGAVASLALGGRVKANLLKYAILSGSSQGPSGVLQRFLPAFVDAKNNLSVKMFPVFVVSGVDDGSGNYWFIEVQGSSISNVSADPWLSTTNNRFTYRPSFLGVVTNTLDIALMEYARGASAWHCTLAPGEVTQ